MLPEAALKALAHQQRRSVKSTRQKLELALSRLIKGNPQIVKSGTKISAASVAKEAEIDRATLYRFHEPILVEIRKINDTSPKTLLKGSRLELAQTKPKLKEYRRLVEEAQNEVSALARINYQLDAKITELQEALEIKNGIISALQKQLNINYIKNN